MAISNNKSKKEIYFSPKFRFFSPRNAGNLQDEPAQTQTLIRIKSPSFAVVNYNPFENSKKLNENFKFSRRLSFSQQKPAISPENMKLLTNKIRSFAFAKLEPRCFLNIKSLKLGESCKNSTNPEKIRKRPLSSLICHSERDVPVKLQGKTMEDAMKSSVFPINTLKNNERKFVPQGVMPKRTCFRTTNPQKHEENQRNAKNFVEISTKFVKNTGVSLENRVKLANLLDFQRKIEKIQGSFPLSSREKSTSLQISARNLLFRGGKPQKLARNVAISHKKPREKSKENEESLSYEQLLPWAADFPNNSLSISN